MLSNYFEHLDLQKMPGITFKTFCSISGEEGTCTNEAVGEILAVVEDDITIPLPVCEEHLKQIESQYTIEDLGA